MPSVLKTFVAPLLTSADEPHPIQGPSGDIYWLDQMLHGGIHRPEHLGRPVVVLLSGPPGAGKSLLAQEICFRNAILRVREGETGLGLSSLMITFETPATAVADNMNKLGFTVLLPEPGSSRARSLPADAGAVAVQYAFLAGQTPRADFQPEWGDHTPAMIIASPAQPPQQWTYSIFMDHVNGCWTKACDHARPRVLVLDSLNVLSQYLERKKERTRAEEEGKQTERETEIEKEGVAAIYDRLVNGFPKDRSPDFLILVVDTPGLSGDPHSTEHDYWEYVADVVIRVDYRYEEQSYFTRQLEIIKTRFQPHTLGRQLVKIFPKEDRVDPEGARPNLTTGGFFIFPSEHYLLSRIRTLKPLISVSPRLPSQATSTIANQSKPFDRAPAPSGPGSAIRNADASKRPVALNWPVQWCYELVGGGGVPYSQTTAIVGRRGLHKSYFAYQFLLDGVANGETTLTISFRDDPGSVRATLERISEARQYKSMENVTKIDKYNKIIYQRPGYVTPQEFLHRVIAAVGEHSPTRVMITAVDQWEAAYPLLARSPILLPTLIDFLNAHGATSMIVGVEAGTRGVDRSGLTAKAEVVLSFEYEELPWVGNPKSEDKRESGGYATDGYPIGVLLRQHRKAADANLQAKVVVRAVRVPYGRAGLARAVVEYQHGDDNLPAGLQLVPLAPEYPLGRLL